MGRVMTFLNKKSFLCFTWADVLFAVLSAIIFLLFLLQNVPIANDDLIYRFDQRGFDGDETLMTPISSWKQLFESNVEGYMYGNGRFIVHCIIQLILGFGGFWILYVFSPLLFAIFLLSSLYLIRRKL